MSDLQPVVSEWRQRFWMNAGSGYVATIVSALCGIFTFRMMWGCLSKDDFGLWVVLWSWLGWGAMLDFGLGLTLQRAVAGQKDSPDSKQVAEVAAMVIGVMAVISLIALIVGLLLADSILSVVGADPGLPDHQGAFRMFLMGFCIQLPLAATQHLLQGIHRYFLLNVANAAAAVLNLALVLLGGHWGWTLTSLIGVSMGCQFLPGIISLMAARRHFTGMRLYAQPVTIDCLTREFRFSSSAYLITGGNLANVTVDRSMVGMLLGISAVAPYQGGWRVADLLRMVFMRIQTPLFSAGADMHFRGDRAGIATAIIDSSRISLMVGIAFATMALLHVEALLHILTGEMLPRESVYAAIVLTVGNGVAGALGGSARPILAATGAERFILVTTWMQVVSGIVSSIILAPHFGILGIACGWACTTAAIHIFVVLPKAISMSEVGVSGFLKAHAVDVMIAGVAAAITVSVSQWIWPVATHINAFGLVLRGCCVALPFLLLIPRLRQTMRR